MAPHLFWSMAPFIAHSEPTVKGAIQLQSQTPYGKGPKKLLTKRKIAFFPVPAKDCKLCLNRVMSCLRQKIAGFPMRSRTGKTQITHGPRMPTVQRRRAGVARVLPSVLISRICLFLMVAPWIILLALKNLLAIDSVTSSNFFFVLLSELSIITLSGMAVVSTRIRELKHYEACREHERLLFSYARDAMLLVKVHYDKSSPDGLSFVIQAENPAAVERLSSIGQAETYVGIDIEDAFPLWLRANIRKEYVKCTTSQRVHRYEVCYPDGRLAHESIATPVLVSQNERVSHIIVIMRDAAERIAQERERLAGGFELTVTDTGIGMSEEDTQIALQPFGQVESAFSRNHNGTGLGLPIAAHLAKLHGGELSLTSSLGLGTRVIIKLPSSRALMRTHQTAHLCAIDDCANENAL